MDGWMDGWMIGWLVDWLMSWKKFIEKNLKSRKEGRKEGPWRYFEWVHEICEQIRLAVEQVECASLRNHRNAQKFAAANSEEELVLSRAYNYQTTYIE